jgi:hypothetical protein
LVRQWRIEIAEGYSGPTVSEGCVFTVETRDRRDEIVRAFARHSGKELWSAKWAGSMSVPFFSWRNGSWVRSTPASTGRRCG